MLFLPPRLAALAMLFGWIEARYDDTVHILHRIASKLAPKYDVISIKHEEQRIHDYISAPVVIVAMAVAIAVWVKWDACSGAIAFIAVVLVWGVIVWMVACFIMLAYRAKRFFDRRCPLH